MENNGIVGVDSPLPPQKKLGRFKASQRLFWQSWELLKKDKEIVLFPILSIFTNLLIFVPIAIFLFFISGVDENSETTQAMGVEGYVFLFSLYLIGYFIASFFQAGLVTVVHGRIQGKDLTFKDGFSNAVRHGKKIFIWSLIAATVGIVMNLVVERVKTLGKIVVWLFGALWSVLTFFIVPVLILEDLSPVNSIQQSGVIFKRTWGETVIMNISLSLHLFFYYIFGFLVFIALFALGIFFSSILVIVGSIIALVIYFVALSIIGSSLNAIFKVVLYEYAKTGVVPEGFDPELIQNAIRAK